MVRFSNHGGQAIALMLRRAQHDIHGLTMTTLLVTTYQNYTQACHAGWLRPF